MGLLNPHRAQIKSALVLTMCLIASCIAPASATNEKVLVLLDSLEMQETHSKFLHNINPKVFDVTVGTMDTKSIKLREWDNWLFDKLVILGGATSKTAIQSVNYVLVPACLISTPYAMSVLSSSIKLYIHKPINSSVTYFFFLSRARQWRQAINHHRLFQRRA